MYSDLEKRISELQRILPDYEDDLSWARKHAELGDQRSALTKCRICTDRVIETIYERDLRKKPGQRDDPLSDSDLIARVDRRVLIRIRLIRELGNLGVHANREPIEECDASLALESLCEVLGWYVERYERHRRRPGSGRTVSERPDVDPTPTSLTDVEFRPPHEPVRWRGRQRRVLGGLGICAALLAIAGFVVLRSPRSIAIPPHPSVKPTQGSDAIPTPAAQAQQVQPPPVKSLSPPPPVASSLDPGPAPVPPLEPDWKLHASGTPFTLHALWRTPQGLLYIAGDEGVILHSQDGGRTFKRQPTHIRESLYALSGAPDGTVYAVGTDGVILRALGPTAPWTRLPTHRTDDLRGAYATEGGDLYAVGERGLILRLDPAGSITSLPAGTTDCLRAVRLLGRDLYAVGDGGTILRARGGRPTAWRRLDSGTQGSLWDIGIAGEVIVVVGSEKSQAPSGEPAVMQGFVLRSEDGASFSRVPSRQVNPLYSIAAHGTDLYAAGIGRRLLHSTDRGLHWLPEGGGDLEAPSPPQFHNKDFRFGVFGTKDGDLYLVGRRGALLHRSAATALARRPD